MTVLRQALSIQKNGREILRATLPENQALIGRSPVCDIVLRAPHVTAIHFLLEKQNIEMADNVTTSLWLLFDISSEKMDSTEKQEQIRSAEGLVLTSKSSVVGGFEFQVVNDSLASTMLAKDAFIKNVMESSAKQAQNIKHQAAHLNAVECLLYERQSHSVIAQRHLSLKKRGRLFRPFAVLPEIEVRMPKSDADPSFFQISRKLPVQLRNHGALLEPDANTSNFKLLKNDFIEVQTPRYDVYFRYVIFEAPEIPEHPRLKWTAGFFVLGLLIFAAVSLGVFQNFMPERPTPRERVVSLKTEPLIEDVREIPPQPPPPQPVSMAPKPVVAPVAKAKTAKPPSDSKEWKSTLSKLKKYGTNKGPQVKAESLLDSGQRTTRLSPSLSVNSPRRLEDSQESLKSTTNQNSSNPSFNPGGKNNESLARVDVGTIKATVGLDSSAESNISGGLSKAQVQETINRSRAQIRSCYQKQLVLKPSLQGRILYSWIVQPSGEVRDVETKSSTLPSKEVKICIQQVIRAMTFPPSENQTATRVLYPFYLAPY